MADERTRRLNQAIVEIWDEFHHEVNVRIQILLHLLDLTHFFQHVVSGLPPGKFPPTGRTGQRSAFPGLRAALPGGVCAERAPRRHGAMRGFAALRAAVPAPTGRTGQRSAFPGLRAALPGGVGAERSAAPALGDAWFRCASRSGAGPHRENWPEVGVPLPACCSARWGRCGEERRADGWGRRRRGPAGRCAGPHRENWPEVGVPWPACCSARWGRCGEERRADGWGRRRRGPAGRCAGPHRENWPEVGVPWPACCSARWGSAERGAAPPVGGARFPLRCGQRGRGGHRRSLAPLSA